MITIDTMFKKQQQQQKTTTTKLDNHMLKSNFRQFSCEVIWHICLYSINFLKRRENAQKHTEQKTTENCVHRIWTF